MELSVPPLPVCFALYHVCDACVCWNMGKAEEAHETSLHKTVSSYAPRERFPFLDGSQVLAFLVPVATIASSADAAKCTDNMSNEAKEGASFWCNRAVEDVARVQAMVSPLPHPSL